jgi:hypothetical protein
MIVPEVDRLVAALGGPEAARGASDETVMRAIHQGGFGQQRIASYLMGNHTNRPIPLNRSFLLMGQRYVVDSHVLSNVVYDRVGKRMMPTTLDAAFGALGNNQALALIPDLGDWPELPGALARVRTLVDSNEPAFWESSFYNLWLSSLRALSPGARELPVGAKVPAVASTEAWGRRILNTQLASWAELRHDTLLYAKQSYSGVPMCEFPDAYVDPYPEAFAAIRKYAEQGTRISKLAQGRSPELAASIDRYFEALRSASSILEQIATRELAGQELTAEHLAFINDIVRVDHQNAGCTTIDIPNGWLAKLYYTASSSIEFSPTIADVHTQPADESGNPVGRVLHVGTGYPRLMVVTVDSCGGGPRAYAGVVFAYHEQVTEKFDRINDQEWAVRFRGDGKRPADVPWLSGLMGAR